jgi:hypothetical protein
MADTQRSFMFPYQFALLCKKLLEHHHKTEREEINVGSTNEVCVVAVVFLGTIRRTTQQLDVGMSHFFNFYFLIQELTHSYPIFLPTAYFPALICFGRERG